MVGWLGLPQAMFSNPLVGRREDIAPPQSFTWGAGGTMLTPEEMAHRRAMADQRGQADFSPVASPWEGLGRVAENVFGALESRKLDKSAGAAADHSRAILEALRDPKTADPNAVVTALTDPYASEAVRGLAGKIYDRQNPKPVNNDTAADFALFDEKLGPGMGNQMLRDKLDPVVTIPTPFGPYVGRESQFAATMAGMQGGGAQPGAAQPPATLPPDFDFGQGGQTGAPSGGFRDAFSGF